MTEKAAVSDLISPSPLSISLNQTCENRAHQYFTHTHTSRDHLSRRRAAEAMPKATVEMRRQNRSCDQCRKAKRACDLYLRDPQHNVKRPNPSVGRVGNASLTENYLGKRPVMLPYSFFHYPLAVARERRLIGVIREPH